MYTTYVLCVYTHTHTYMAELCWRAKVQVCGHLIRLWVRIPPGAWIYVAYECCVLSGRRLCDGLITRPEEPFRLWCVILCDPETWIITRSWPALGSNATRNNCICIYIYIYIYVCVCVCVCVLNNSIVHSEVHVQSAPDLRQPRLTTWSSVQNTTESRAASVCLIYSIKANAFVALNTKNLCGIWGPCSFCD